MIHLIDSNVYIHGFRDSAFGEILRQFHREHLPQLVLSVVVVHELLVGAGSVTRERSLRRGLIEPSRKTKTARAGTADMGDGSEH